MIRKNLLLTASVGAIAVTGAFTASAQTEAMKTDAFTSDGKARTASETAELYTSTIAYLMETIEKDMMRVLLSSMRCAAASSTSCPRWTATP